MKRTPMKGNIGVPHWNGHRQTPLFYLYQILFFSYIFRPRCWLPWRRRPT